MTLSFYQDIITDAKEEVAVFAEKTRNSMRSVADAATKEQLLELIKEFDESLEQALADHREATVFKKYDEMYITSLAIFTINLSREGLADILKGKQ